MSPTRVNAPPANPSGRRASLWAALTVAALAFAALLSAPRPAHAQRPQQQRRPGKVLLIRGAFTVFSLGLDTLADKLKEYSLDVEVVPAYQASAATERLRDAYLRNPMPLVIIGHSKGGYLAPDCAAELAKSHVPVSLVVIVDNPHEVTLPANVQRCVNFYQTNYLGVVVGARAQAESRRTQLYNLDVDRLPRRDEGGYIDHFNIHSSPWVHKMIIGEVLRACPVSPVGAAAKPAVPNRAAMNDAAPREDEPRRVLYRDRLAFPPGELKVRR